MSALLLCRGIPGGANRAASIGSALARAAAAGKTVAKRESRRSMPSVAAVFQPHKNINNIQRGGNGGFSINFGYRGGVIPLEFSIPRWNAAAW